MRVLLLAAMLPSCSGAPVGVCPPRFPDGAVPPGAEACYPPDAGRPDAKPPDANFAVLTCAELVDRAAGLFPYLDRGCATVDDCVVVGAASSCDCSPSLARGSGVAASKAGASDPGLVLIEAEYGARCQQCTGGNPCVCDAAPALLACDRGRCTATSRSCLVPPDAGP